MNNLKLFRNTIGLTTREISKKIGVSQSLYEKVEFGHRQASRNFINKFKLKYPQINLNIFFDE